MTSVTNQFIKNWLIHNQFRKNKVGNPVVANESSLRLDWPFCRLTPLVAHCALCVITTSGLQCLDEMSSWDSGYLIWDYRFFCLEAEGKKERKSDCSEQLVLEYWDPWWLKYKSTWEIGQQTEPPSSTIINIIIISYSQLKIYNVNIENQDTRL